MGPCAMWFDSASERIYFLLSGLCWLWQNVLCRPFLELWLFASESDAEIQKKKKKIKKEEKKKKEERKKEEEACITCWSLRHGWIGDLAAAGSVSFCTVRLKRELDWLVTCTKSFFGNSPAQFLLHFLFLQSFWSSTFSSTVTSIGMANEVFRESPFTLRSPQMIGSQDACQRNI